MKAKVINLTANTHFEKHLKKCYALLWLLSDVKDQAGLKHLAPAFLTMDTCAVYGVII